MNSARVSQRVYVDVVMIGLYSPNTVSVEPKGSVCTSFWSFSPLIVCVSACLSEYPLNSQPRG